ncbi:MAG: DUF3800 domain-containing protein [Treponema sp.]|jgi:hypothetical protein|nr:DUF3800 domain-containing protein [Treponema sp.]
MFAFIDESGHTGKKISDTSQPNFFSLGIVSKYNPDILIMNDLSQLTNSIGVKELHGAELGPKIETISYEIYRMLQKLSPKFFLAEVDKKYLAYTKLYDTLFDNVENPAGRWHTYQMRPFRMLLLNNFITLVPLDIAYNFYENCLFASNEEQAIDVLKDTCDEILGLIDGSLDSRSRQLISDPLIWAKNNPKEITTYNAKKSDRWRHLPNVVTFLPMLNMFSRCAKSMNSKINKIVHDEQNQMKEIFIEIHKMAANIKGPGKLDLRENGYLHLKNIKESVFEMKESTNSPGLQIVDICLYLICHKDVILNNHSMNPGSAYLLMYIVTHGTAFDFTLNGFIRESNELQKKIAGLPLTDEELQKGQDIVNEMEDKWRENFLKVGVS